MSIRHPLVLAVALALAACADPPDDTLTTRHPTAVVHSQLGADGLPGSELRALDGAVLARVAIHGADPYAAAFTWADGAETVFALDGDAAAALDDLTRWHWTLYGIYQLGVFLRGGAPEVPYCHQNAAGAGCRGACGVDCESCTTAWVCAKASDVCGGPGGDDFVWTRVYSCYSRPCCVTHDACYDACGNGFGSSLCRRKCDAQALGNGCGVADARGQTGGKPDATPATYYHPTGISCFDVVDVEVVERLVGQATTTGSGGEATGSHPVTPTSTTTQDATTASGADAPRDVLCLDHDDWWEEAMLCPRDAACASCIWGS